MNLSNTRSIGKGYGFYLPIGIGIIILMLVVYIILSIIYSSFWNNVWSTRLWWINFFPLLAVGLFISMLACVLKGEDDRKTNDRGLALHNVCQNINRNILRESDVKVKMGDFSAWIEISYDPSKSTLFRF